MTRLYHLYQNRLRLVSSLILLINIIILSRLTFIYNSIQSCDEICNIYIISNLITWAFYNYFIIIPAYAEKLYLKYTLNSINKQDQKILNQTLVIIVINNSRDDDQKIKKNNNTTYQRIINLSYNFEFILIDCFSSQYALSREDAGVGLARKIGMDYCIKFSNKNSLFCSIDADTIINNNYLKSIAKEYKCNKL